VKQTVGHLRSTRGPQTQSSGLLKQFREGNSAGQNRRSLRPDEGRLRPPSQLSWIPGRRPGLVVAPDQTGERHLRCSHPVKVRTRWSHGSRIQPEGSSVIQGRRRRWSKWIHCHHI
jgi:hypothetical protein